VATRVGVFLDRDGVIVEQVDHLRRVEDLRLLPGSAEAIARLNRAGIPVVVVTNQAAIAMDYLTVDGLLEIHRRLREELAKHEARWDALYFCPHHPEASLPELRADCLCRKPGTAMLEKGRDDLGIDLSRSYVVGDMTADILAGQRAGCRTVLVDTGLAGIDGRYEVVPDLRVPDLAAAVDAILKEVGR